MNTIIYGKCSKIFDQVGENNEKKQNFLHIDANICNKMFFICSQRLQLVLDFILISLKRVFKLNCKKKKILEKQKNVKSDLI